MGWLSDRVLIAREILGRRWFKVAFGAWSFLASYDLLVSQILPEHLAEKAPKIRDLLAETSGWLQWWGWLLILAGIIMSAMFEYAARTAKRQAKTAAQGHRFFTFSDNAFCESRSIKWEDGGSSDYYETTFYLVVGNALKTGQTLKRVQARIYFIGEPVLARVKESGESSIDIRHGEFAFFEIGKIVSSELIGTMQGSVVYDNKAKMQYSHNIPLGALSFEVRSAIGKREYGLGHYPDGPPNVWALAMAISADDAIALQVKVSIDLLSKTPVAIHAPD